MKVNIFFILTTVLWGLNYHWSKFMLEEVSSYEGAFWRYAIATIILILLTIKNLPSFKTILINAKGILIIGGVGLFGFNFFFFQGMNATSPINAALIIGLNPGITMILSALILKTSVSLKQILGMIIALFGVFFLLFKGNLNSFIELKLNSGDGLIMLANLFFALHHVWVKKYSNKTISNAQLSLSTAVTCLICLSLLLTFDLLINPHQSSFKEISNYSMKFWFSASGIGALGTGLAYWFWYKGIDLSNAAKASVFINIVPLSTAVFFIVFGSELESFHIISGAIIISGILVMQIKTVTVN